MRVNRANIEKYKKEKKARPKANTSPHAIHKYIAYE